MSIFCVSLVGCTTVLIGWCAGIGNSYREPVYRQTPHTHGSLLGDQAFAFLSRVPSLEQGVRSPFAFQVTVEAKSRARWTPPRHRPRDVRPAEPKPKPAPVAPDPAPALPAAEPVEGSALVRRPTRQVVRGFRMVKYVYSMPLSSGKQQAIVQIRDPVAKTAARAHTVGVGDRVDGLTIRGFDGEYLQLIDGDGRHRRVPFGGELKVRVAFVRVLRP